MLLKAYRRKMGLTARAFAALAGTSHPQVFRWERVPPQIPRLRHMARIREVTGGLVTETDFYQPNDEAGEPEEPPAGPVIRRKRGRPKRAALELMQEPLGGE